MTETRLTLRTTAVSFTSSEEAGEITISEPCTGMSGTEFVETLVKPLMLAAGYHPGTVSEALGEDAD